jgi:hypothetical protein
MSNLGDLMAARRERLARAGHQPWCANHVDNVCFAAHTGPVSLSYAPGDGPLIYIDDPGEDLTPAEAERLARAILAEVARARAALAGGAR